MRRFNKWAYVLAGLLLVSSQAHAWYQVEIIVFDYLSPDTGGEYWDSEPGLVPLSNTVIPVPAISTDLETDTEPETESEDETEIGSETIEDTVLIEPSVLKLVPYMLLPESRHRLDGIFRNLRLSGNYRPLYHTSWQQPAVDGNLARAVHLQAEDSSNLFELTIPPTLFTRPLPIEFYEPIKLVFDGTVRIRSSTFLHVDVDMVLFREPPYLTAELETNDADSMVDSDVINELPPSYVRLRETRRIRLNELHYFDHPMFGVILQVSRLEPEEEE